MRSVPGLEECLMQGSEEEVDTITELVILLAIQWNHSILMAVNKLSKGVARARGNDTKSIKSAVLDWITLRGQGLVPPLAHNVKVDCGFNHKCTGTLLCPTGLDWSNPE
jgi:hypothetical protein